MKQLKIIALLTCIITVILLGKTSSTITINVILNFVAKILPTLAPALILNNILLSSGGIYPLFENLKISEQLKHRLYLFSLILLGVLSGTPMLATIINKEKGKTISDDEAQNIMNHFAFPSLSFLLILIINSSWPKNYTILLLVIPFSIAIISYLLSSKKTSIQFQIKCQDTSNNILSTAILNSFQTIILMAGSMILFSLFLIPLTKIPTPFSLYIQGFLEFSYPLSYLTSSFSPANFIFSLIIISFSSLSLIIQIHLLAPKISIKEVIKKRLLIALFASLIGLIFLF